MVLDGKLCQTECGLWQIFSGEYYRLTAPFDLTKHCMLYTSYCIHNVIAKILCTSDAYAVNVVERCGRGGVGEDKLEMWGRGRGEKNVRETKGNKRTRSEQEHMQERGMAG